MWVQKMSRDMEMSVFLPTACYALCQPLENANAPSFHHGFFSPSAHTLYHRGKFEDCKEEASRRRLQTSVSNRFNIKSWNWRQDVLSRGLFITCIISNYCCVQPLQENHSSQSGLRAQGARKSSLPPPRYNVQRELGDTFGWFMLDPHKLWVATLLHWSVCSLGHRKDPPVTRGTRFLPLMAKPPVTGKGIATNQLYFFWKQGLLEAREKEQTDKPTTLPPWWCRMPAGVPSVKDDAHGLLDTWHGHRCARQHSNYEQSLLIAAAEYSNQ